MNEPGTLLTASAMAIGVIVWLVRLEGRVNLTEATMKEVKEDLREIKGDVKTLLQK